MILFIDISTGTDTFGSEAIFLYGLPRPAYSVMGTITTRDASVLALATVDIYANLKIFNPKNNVRYLGSIVYFTND